MASSVLLAIALAVSTPVAAETNEGWLPSADPAYRQSVIASVARMDTVDDRLERTVRHAYLAFDNGPGSSEAADLQGFPSVVSLLWKFELIHETRTVHPCTLELVYSGREALEAVAARLGESQELPMFLAFAEAQAPTEYAQALAGAADPSASQRALAAMSALGAVMGNGTASPETSAFFSYYLSIGSDGKCPSSPRLRLLVQSNSPKPAL